MSDADPGQGAGAGSQSGNGQDWVAGLNLDDESRESIRKTTFGSAEDLAKGYLSLQSKLGKTVQIPGDGATEEQRMEFLRKLGMPETVEGYDLSKPQDLPQGINYDADFENAFRAAAHKAGLTKKQAQDLFGWYNNRLIGQVKQIGEENTKALTSAIETMKQEWGDRYDAEHALTLRAVEKFGGADLKNFFNETGLGNNPVLIRAFNKVAHAVGEDSLVGGEEPGAAPQREPGVLNYPSMKGLQPVND